MSLAREAYVRVQQGVDAGALLKTVCVSVAAELNALGIEAQGKNR